MTARPAWRVTTAPTKEQETAMTTTKRVTLEADAWTRVHVEEDGSITIELESDVEGKGPLRRLTLPLASAKQVVPLLREAEEISAIRAEAEAKVASVVARSTRRSG